MNDEQIHAQRVSPLCSCGSKPGVNRTEAELPACRPGSRVSPAVLGTRAVTDPPSSGLGSEDCLEGQTIFDPHPETLPLKTESCFGSLNTQTTITSANRWECGPSESRVGSVLLAAPACPARPRLTECPCLDMSPKNLLRGVRASPCCFSAD